MIELLVVAASLSLLASLISPVFLKIRGEARQVACASNLRQIGLGLTLYTQDYDELYPCAVDPIDLIMRDEWSRTFPSFGTLMPHLGIVHEVLQPYVQSRLIFSCPSDIGFAVPDYIPVTVNAFPSSYNKFGTSYFYRTEIAARGAGQFSIESPSQINVIYENVGDWHGTLIPIAGRYNTLFVDGHVSALTLAQTIDAWRTPLNSRWAAPLPD
jgi:general secretion pathway protein G